MHSIRKFGIVFFIYSLLYFNVSAMDTSLKSEEDTIPLYSYGVIKKSIYPQDSHKRSRIYNLIAGKHYRKLYATPITVKSTELYDLHGGLKFIGQLPRLHALFFESKDAHLYMVRPLGGATTFMESDFFKNIYNKQEYQGTYFDKFIGDAYTITHPYAFMVANKLAEGVGVNSFDSEIYYIPKHTTADTVADGTGIAGRLISLYDLKAFAVRSKVIQTEELMTKIQESKAFHADQHEYIRERLLDILIGDWNKTKESWQWYEMPRGDSLVYLPWVADRSHAFTKVDGVLLELMLDVLGLSSITNYDSNIKNLRKANGIGIPLDIALVARTEREVWYQEAKYIKSLLTDSLIDNAFKELPEEIYVSPDTEIIKRNLKNRRDMVENIAQRYYDILQQNPLITGTNGNDLFVINQEDRHTTNIRIYDRNSKLLLFDKEYNKNTEEIWLYGLDGDDEFRLKNESGSATPLILLGGKGSNIYNVTGGRNTDIYDYKSHDVKNDTLDKADMTRTDIEKVHTYDYNKIKYQTLSFTPWGVYDSDLGFYLGAYLTRTMYGFKRSPYSYRHRIGYSYLDGLVYQGLFPSLDEMKGFNIEAIFGIANDFHNFFGFGNQTNGFRDRSNDYNRVDIGKYSIEPSFYWKLDKANKFTAAPIVELYDINVPTGRFINEIYEKDNAVFDTRVFADLHVIYEMNKEFNTLLNSIDFLVTGGWNWDVKDLSRNFPYLKSKFGFNIQFGDRLSLATEVIGAALFSNDYQFYQAASVELRGFRESRFIGKQSLYQHTDLRLDLGHLKNPFTPIQYGVFVGIDYGRVWYPHEESQRWHTSYGGGWWLTLFKQYTGKFSYFGSNDGNRFFLGIGMGF